MTIAGERMVEDVVVGPMLAPPDSDMNLRLAELRCIKEQAREGGDPKATARQTARGKLTVRERLDLLFDPGIFCEVEALRRHRARGFGLEDNRPHRWRERMLRAAVKFVVNRVCAIASGVLPDHAARFREERCRDGDGGESFGRSVRLGLSRGGRSACGRGRAASADR